MKWNGMEAEEVAIRCDFVHIWSLDKGLHSTPMDLRTYSGLIHADIDVGVDVDE